MNKSIEYYIPGEPYPKRYGQAKINGVIRQHVKTKTQAWERVVTNYSRLYRPSVEFSGSIEIILHFFLLRPNKKKFNARPIGFPDLDNLCKSTIDGIKKARVFGDDNKIVGIHATKSYAAQPGVNVSITLLENPILTKS